MSSLEFPVLGEGLFVSVLECCIVTQMASRNIDRSSAEVLLVWRVDQSGFPETNCIHIYPPESN